MRVIKPRRISLITKPLEEPPRSFLVITALVMADALDPGTLYTDQALLAFAAKALGETPFDLGMPKPVGELLVYGAAQAPGGRPVSGLDVRVRLGAIEKTVRVFGERTWSLDADGRTIRSDPKPFVELALDYANAFGGPGFARNTRGKGHGARAALRRGEPLLLPNLETPGRPILDPDDTHDPACFAALDLQGPQRQAFLGRYDQRWLQEKYPGHPDDTDWHYYNTAPRDQWAEGYFTGAETFTVQGMHRDHSVLTGRLPGLAVQALVNRSPNRYQPGKFEQVPMRLDTVWLFGSHAKVLLAYRGVVETRFEDAGDIESVLLAAEALAGPRRPEGYYRHIWDLRSGDADTQIRYVLSDHQLMPPLPADEQRHREQQREARREALRAEDAERSRQQQAHLLETMGFPSLAGVVAAGPGEDEPFLPALKTTPVFTEEELADGDLDLAELFDWTDALLEQAQAKADEVQALGQRARDDPLAFLQDQGVDLSAARESLDGLDLVAPPVDLLKQRRLAEAKACGLAGVADGLFETEALLEAARQGFEAAGAGSAVPGDPAAQTSPAPELGDEFKQALPFDFDRFMAELRAAEAVGRAAGGTPTLDHLESQLADAKANLAEGLAEGRRISPEPLAPVEPWEAAVAASLAAAIRAEAAAGADLSGRDLAGAPLAGIDLSHRPLRGTFFENADLSNADLSGSDCTGAVFTGAKLDGACFEGAVLKDANFSMAHGTGVDFSNSSLTDVWLLFSKLPDAKFCSAHLTDLMVLQADLSGADLTETALTGVMLIQTALGRLTAGKARLTGCMLVDLTLAESDFTGAHFDSVAFAKVAAERCLFDDGRMDSVVFAGPPSLSYCGFRRARLDKAVLYRAELRKCDFSGATLKQVDLTEADLTGSSFWCASFDQSLLTWAKADETTFFEARFKEVSLNRASLRRSNLASTRFYRTSARKIDSRGSETLDRVLTKSLLTEEALERDHDPG